MKYLLIATIILNIIVFLNCSQLKFVTQLYRHGARGALGKNASPEKKYMASQLTGVGMRQQYILGKTLREKYMDQENFLSSTLNFTEIFILSTEVNRTLMSAQSNLYGFYPLDTGLTVPEGIEEKYLLPPYKGVEFEDLGLEALPHQYQPGIIHTQNDKTNILLSPQAFCNLTPIWLAQYLKTPEFKQYYSHLNQEFALTILETGQMMGNPHLTLRDIPDVYDVILSDQYAGNKLPYGFDESSEMWRNVTFLNDIFSYKVFEQPLVQRLGNTPIFYDLLNSFNAAIDGSTNGFKYTMFSAHDDNLSLMLPFLNITNTQCITELFNTGKTDAINCQPYPPFASNLLIELHQEDEGDYFVMVNYNGEYQNLCEKKDTKCSFSEFQDRIKLQIADQKEFNEVCLNTGKDYVNFNDFLILQVQNKKSYSDMGNDSGDDIEPISEIKDSHNEEEQTYGGNNGESINDSSLLCYQVLAVCLFVIILAVIGYEFYYSRKQKQPKSEYQNMQVYEKKQQQQQELV